jgi:hypothetical protein
MPTYDCALRIEIKKELVKEFCQGILAVEIESPLELGFISSM